MSGFFISVVRRSRKLDRTGNAAVEFALVAPLLLAMLLGTLGFGLYFGVAHSVQQLASEAARASVAGVSASERLSLALASVNAGVGTYALLRPQALTIQAGFAPSDPDLFTITLTYDGSSLGLNAFSGLLAMPGNVVVRSATIRRGGA